MIIYIVCLMGLNLGNAGFQISVWAIIADCIEVSYRKTGKSEEGSLYAIYSFFRKLAQGIGPSIVIFIMGYLGYEEKLGTIGQSFETAQNMCWLVAGLYLFSAVLQFIGIALIYNLDKKKVDTMNAELEARRNA
jgi:GPH family glycoside/pentoside/hexuronide:cation symporter